MYYEHICTIQVKWNTCRFCTMYYEHICKIQVKWNMTTDRRSSIGTLDHHVLPPVETWGRLGCKYQSTYLYSYVSDNIRLDCSMGTPYPRYMSSSSIQLKCTNAIVVSEQTKQTEEHNTIYELLSYLDRAGDFRSGLGCKVVWGFKKLSNLHCGVGRKVARELEKINT